MRFKAAKFFVLGLLSVFTVALSGCYGFPNLINSQDIKLEDYVLAMRLSSQTRDMWYDDNGYIVFVKEDGSTQVLRTEVMDNGNLMWSEEGIYVGEWSNELLISSGEIKSVKRKNVEEYQNTQYKFSGYNISIYNTGFEKNSYLERIYVNDFEAGIKVIDFPGSIEGSFACGESIFGIILPDFIEKPRLYAYLDLFPDKRKEFIKNSEFPFLILEQLYPNSDYPKKLGSVVTSDSVIASDYETISYLGNANSCLDGIGYFFMAENYYYEQNSNEDDYIPYLVKWDTTTGQTEKIILNSSTGHNDEMPSFDDLASATSHFYNGKFYWASDLGEIFITDTNTGITHKIRKVDHNRLLHTQLSFVDGLVHILEYPVGKSVHEDISYSIFNLETEEETKQFTIRGIENFRNYGWQIFRAMAVNPNR